ncbi:UNKNOWN [Stylonychia lemnae]|uniref:Uncharacterized protein n=1 Tax=Stylonychia lemnae TaxID=5949 RepID=A0A078AV50_STYLE|nr:UNKNOWN [Stylonychia lemnae]|eukprot:CDW84738.1 UNKNOWN [Stylonychia lemnae]
MTIILRKSQIKKDFFRQAQQLLIVDARHAQTKIRFSVFKTLRGLVHVYRQLKNLQMQKSALQMQVSGTICKYLFRMPPKAGPNDYMIVNTTIMQRAIAIGHIAQTYLEPQLNETVFINSTTSSIKIKYPFQMFMTVYGNSTFKGNFQFKYQFIDMPGPDGNTPQTNSRSSSTTDEFSLLSIILIAVFVPVGVILITSVIGLLIYFHRKNTKLKRIKQLKSNSKVKEPEKIPEKGINFANDEEYFKMILSQKIRMELGFDGSGNNSLSGNANFLGNNQAGTTLDNNSVGSDLKMPLQKTDALQSDFGDQNSNEMYKLKTATPEDLKNKNLKQYPSPINDQKYNKVQQEPQVQTQNISRQISSVVPHQQQQTKTISRQVTGQEVNYDDQRIKRAPTNVMSIQQINQQYSNQNNNSLPPINVKGSSLPPISFNNKNQFGDLMLQEADDDL